jgi:hypothetical protein
MRQIQLSNVKGFACRDRLMSDSCREKAVQIVNINPRQEQIATTRSDPGTTTIRVIWYHDKL